MTASETTRTTLFMTDFLARPHAPRLAYDRLPGTGPTVVFLPGYMSDRAGVKALALEAACRERGQAMLRFDYRGCGESEGAFADGTISRWTQDALDIIDALTDGPLLLVGSSMGGWIALNAALAHPTRLQGLILLAAAPDFTRWGVIPTLTPAEQALLQTQGYILRTSVYGTYGYTKALLDDGEARCLLHNPIALTCPVRLLHGQADDVVPWQISLDIAAKLTSPDVQVTLIKNGDHRLSTPRTLSLLTATLAELSAPIPENHLWPAAAG